MELKENKLCIDDLEITFQRTVRVPNSIRSSALPPNMGIIPLFLVSKYAKRLPAAMVAKGGAFFPMHMREAMWINFKSHKTYYIKVYTGGVNIISGEPANETVATRLRRQTLLAQGKTVQDYIIVSPCLGQRSLDGIATGDGVVGQFVAMPTELGRSAEAQITGGEVMGGIQFEVTPVKPQLELMAMQIFVKDLSGKTFTILTNSLQKIGYLKQCIYEERGIPSNMQRLRCHGYPDLQDERTLSDYGIRKETTLQLFLRLRGGGRGSVHHETQSLDQFWRLALDDAEMSQEMTVASGGQIEQTIVQDWFQENIWDAAQTKTYNVQIINTQIFEVANGLKLLDPPINAQTYCERGLPFFTVHEEPTGIFGNFAKIKPIAEFGDSVERPCEPICTMNPSQWAPRNGTALSDGYDDPPRPILPFRMVAQIERELRKQ